MPGRVAAVVLRKTARHEAAGTASSSAHWHALIGCTGVGSVLSSSLHGTVAANGLHLLHYGGLSMCAALMWQAPSMVERGVWGKGDDNRMLEAMTAANAQQVLVQTLLLLTVK